MRPTPNCLACARSHWIYSSDQLTKIKEHSATNHHEKKKRTTDLNERGKC